jgi:hypothetical protein
MEEDDPITILGLLLTQVRTARRALEEVERNTSRYMGFEFTRALAEGPGFGAPPLYQGALMVHVVNINDLAPGNGFGGFLQTVLGGLGNFVGGLLGGVVSGTLSGFALPRMIASMDRITQTILAILNRLGVDRRAATGSEAAEGSATANNENSSSTPAEAVTGESLATQLDGISTLVRNLTALFQVASSGPGDSASANAAGRRAPEVLSEAGSRWLTMLNAINTLLDRTSRIVDGLIPLLGFAIGSIALLIGNLGGIRRALLETMQFLLRNVLVLRGVILTTIFETVAAVARLAASIVTILGTALQSALTAVLTVIGGLLDAAFDTLSTLATALQAVIRSLLQWLVNDVFTVLRAIGGLQIFRTVDHFARILPSLLEPIYMIVVAYQGGQSARLPDDLSSRLQAAHDAAFGTSNPGNSAGAGAGGAPGTAVSETIIGAPPDLASIIDPLGVTLSSALDATGAQLSEAMQATFSGASGTLGGIAGAFDAAIRREADQSRNVLSNNLGTLIERADRLAQTIQAPIDAKGPSTGFEEIAAAYSDWLTTRGGLDSILSLATSHFQNPPGGADGGVPGLVRGGFDRSRASIEIDSVEIVIEPPETVEGSAPLGPGDFPLPDMSDEAIWLAWFRHNTEMEDRVISPRDLRALYA